VRPRLLVVRSGGRPFPGELAPGLEVVDRSTHEIEALEPDARALDRRFDFVIVTSQTAVEQLVANESLRARLSGRIIAVGPATAALLRAHLEVAVEDGGGSARRILATLPASLAGRRILLPRGEDANDELARELARRGGEVVPFTLYRKIARPYDPALDTLVTGAAIAVFCATSPSAARWLLEGASPEAKGVLRRTVAVALGKSTREDLVGRGVLRVEVAAVPTFEAAGQLAQSLAGNALGA
jgi:uroporphyrinogen-III synthase